MNRFWAFWHRPPPPPPVTNHAIYIWCVKYKTTTACKRSSLVTVGGEALQYFLPQKQSLQPIFLIGTCPIRKDTFADNFRVEPTIFFMKKLSSFFNFFSGQFYRQSFIRTVRGPYFHTDRYKMGYVFPLLDNNVYCVLVESSILPRQCLWNEIESNTHNYISWAFVIKPLRYFSSKFIVPLYCWRIRFLACLIR